MNDLLAFVKENYTLLALLSFIVFVGKEVWGGYKEHKKDVYAQLNLKRDKLDCKEKMDNHLQESHHD